MNAYEDSSPHIKGNYLVWQGQVDGDSEIFVYDVVAGKGPFQITHNSYDDISPQTDGNYLVWLGFSHFGGEIFLYDLSTGKTTQVTDDSNVDSPPQIADGRVVWTSHAVTASVEPGEIVLYHIATGVTEQLTQNALDDSSPRINDEAIVWVQSNATGVTNLFVHYLNKGTQMVPNGFVWNESPDRDGNLSVLTRYDGNDREIFTHSANSTDYVQITNNDFEDQFPTISGDSIAWVAGSGEAAEIFLYGPDHCPEDPEKMHPGICGCSEAETDSDADKIPDCVDALSNQPIEKGDLDNDGSLDLSDSIIAFQVLMRVETASKVWVQADVNADGKIGMAELIYIVQYIGGYR
jgi:hypothetical protein